MKRLVLVGIVISAAILLVGCSSISKVTKSSSVDKVNPVLVNNTNTIAIVKNDTWKDKYNKVSGKLNSKEGYVGLGALVVAAALTGTWIGLKKSKRGHRK